MADQLPLNPAQGSHLDRTVVVAVLRRPDLWATAARQVVRLARPGWWRRPPRLPVPDPDYLAFRMVTQYGDAAQTPEPEDLVTYLVWCRELARS